MTNPIIFDRRRLLQHCSRAAEALCDFLLVEACERLAERLSEINRTFPFSLDLGAHSGQLAQTLNGRGGIQTLIQTSLSEKQITQAHSLRLVADEEFLPFAPNSFDAVFSICSLHWVNDLPGTLAQVNRCLKPGGLFMAVLPGAQTLKELRESFMQAEMELKGGISPRISPFIEVRDGGSLLQRAGFEMPVADTDSITVSYPHPLKLLHELRAMGEANAMHESTKHFTSCSLMMTMVDRYLRHYSDEAGRIPATFEFVTLTGWKA